MIRETLLAVALAGLVAALALTVMQISWVTPLILKAETFEDAAATQPHAHASAHEHEHAHQHAHEHGAEEWKPHDGLQRTLFTFAANILMGFAYGFMLVAVYLLWREPASAGSGALYGLAGFVAFFVAPSLGLPPELPGTAAAELSERQLWWTMIAVTTGAGLLVLFSRASVLSRVLGAALIAVPHLIAAPQPEAHASLAPEDLQTQFRVASALSNAVFWILLGLASSYAFRKWVGAHVRRDT